MDLDFGIIKAAVAEQFRRLQSAPHQLYRVDVSGDDLWTCYLASFPPGTNPIYRERTEHDCSCCRQFIRTVGNVVAIIDGQMVSLWDATPNNPAYAVVCSALAALVKSKPITGPFLHYEATAGTDRSFEEILGEDGSLARVQPWTHFHVNLDRRFIAAKDAIGPRLSEARSQHDVFLRSLREITDDSIDTVLELIAQGSLYRGEEHKASVVQFRALKQQFAALSDDLSQDLFAWTADISGAVGRMRNTVIGTLLTDLSSGVDLEDAVRSFESKVAPTNYKRPSALITKGMIEQAKLKLAELGLTSALDRRFARLTDITINNVLWADRATRKTITGDVFDELADSTPINLKNLDKVEEVPIGRFLSDILPRVDSIEVMLENRHQGNLVSLIAPVDPTARQLFKWPNNFSWSYVGEVADAIKERVKAAGGSVSGDLCCRLAWSNTDDLDFHMKEPSGYEIYFGNRSATSPSGGRLDVDMNVRGETREPVENIFYASRSTMREGEYHLYVNQYNQRETKDVGFECQIDWLGTVYHFAYSKPVRRGENITVARFRYSRKNGLEIFESLPSTQATRTIWNLSTQSFHRVNALMLSPNFWDDYTVGNKHYLFMLEGCLNDGTARGFFNEFLKEDLNPHRKVFEVVASKMKPADSPQQLSGLGFSSTQRANLICRVKGSFTRTVKITF